MTYLLVGKEQKRQGWSKNSDPEKRISMVEPLQLSVSFYFSILLFVKVNMVHSWFVDLLRLSVQMIDVGE